MARTRYLYSKPGCRASFSQSEIDLDRAEGSPRSHPCSGEWLQRRPSVGRPCLSTTARSHAAFAEALSAMLRSRAFSAYSRSSRPWAENQSDIRRCNSGVAHAASMVTLRQPTQRFVAFRPSHRRFGSVPAGALAGRLTASCWPSLLRSYLSDCRPPPARAAFLFAGNSASKIAGKAKSQASSFSTARWRPSLAHRTTICLRPTRLPLTMQIVGRHSRYASLLSGCSSLPPSCCHLCWRSSQRRCGWSGCASRGSRALLSPWSA